MEEWKDEGKRMSGGWMNEQMDEEWKDGRTSELLKVNSVCK